MQFWPLPPMRWEQRVAYPYGENTELAGLQLKNHGPRNPRFFQRRSPNSFRKSAYHWLRFCQKQVMLNRVFGGYGFCGPVGNYLAVMDAASQFVETRAVSAELSFEGRCIQTSQVPNRPHANLLKSLSRHCTHSRQTSNRQG